MNSLIQVAILLSNILLTGYIERRVFANIENNFLLGSRVKEERLGLEFFIWSRYRGSR